jgi:hypothetical protein
VLTWWSRIILKKLVVAYLAKKFQFMEAKYSEGKIGGKLRRNKEQK